jgi:ketosteroid isomerase-like protein
VAVTTDQDGAAERSEELRSITLRYLAAIDRGDVDAIIARFSRTANLTALPTSGLPIRGPERIKRYTEVEFEAVGRFPVPDPEVEAWVRGDVGWSFGIAKVGEGGRDEVRSSFVFQIENDEWKIVFAHFSIAEREDSEAWAGRSIKILRSSSPRSSARSLPTYRVRQPRTARSRSCSRTSKARQR